MESISKSRSLAALINLPVNYRSNRKIIEFNNDFFNHIGSFVFRNNYFKNTYLEASQEIFQKEEGYVNITLIDQKKKAEKAEIYCEKILEIINSCIKNGYKSKDVCIIVRKRKEGVLIADFLSEKGIDIISSESLLIDSSPDVRFILDTINYCLSEDVASKIEILNYLYNGNKTTELRDDFIKEVEQIKNTILDLLGGIRSTCTYVNARNLKDLSKSLISS
mgnify:CR=1 FL=1